VLNARGDRGVPHDRSGFVLHDIGVLRIHVAQIDRVAGLRPVEVARAEIGDAGDVAREGNYVGGRIDGTVNAYASDDPSGERIRACRVPPGAARLSERWRRGDFLLEVFYDRQGRAILSDGRLCPSQPDGLPELTQYDESRNGWVLRDGGLERFWTDQILYRL
jgi:hypothetical protein